MATTQRTQVNDVVLIRHAQSEWNRAGRFTGWADPALTALGREEGLAAALGVEDAQPPVRDIKRCHAQFTGTNPSG